MVRVAFILVSSGTIVNMKSSGWLVALGTRGVTTGRHGPPTHPQGFNGVDEDISPGTILQMWQKNISPGTNVAEKSSISYGPPTCLQLMGLKTSERSCQIKHFT